MTDTARDSLQRRSDALMKRLTAINGSLLVAHPVANLVTGWTLTDMEHHITQLERLTYRLTHETYPTESGAF